jgi:hypothetical protein
MFSSGLLANDHSGRPIGMMWRELRRGFVHAGSGLDQSEDHYLAMLSGHRHEYSSCSAKVALVIGIIDPESVGIATIVLNVPKWPKH